MKTEAALIKKLGAEEATQNLAVEMAELSQSIFEEGWCDALATIQLDPSSDVWGLCPNYMDSAENGVIVPAKVAANDELKRKCLADEATEQVKSQANLPAITEETTEQTGETRATSLWGQRLKT